MHCQDCVVRENCSKAAAWVNQEEIPEIDCLYVRIHANSFGSPKKLHYAALFTIRKDKASGKLESGMSTDWCKYSSPQTSLNRASNPDKNGLGKVSVSKLYAVAKKAKVDLKAMHDPDREVDNYAHAEIRPSTGQLSTAFRAEAAYSDLLETVISVPTKLVPGGQLHPSQP